MDSSTTAQCSYSAITTLSLALPPPILCSYPRDPSIWNQQMSNCPNDQCIVCMSWKAFKTSCCFRICTVHSLQLPTNVSGNTSTGLHLCIWVCVFVFANLCLCICISPLEPLQSTKISQHLKRNQKRVQGFTSRSLHTICCCFQLGYSWRMR